MDRMLEPRKRVHILPVNCTSTHTLHVLPDVIFPVIAHALACKEFTSPPARKKAGLGTRLRIYLHIHTRYI